MLIDGLIECKHAGDTIEMILPNSNDLLYSDMGGLLEELVLLDMP
jgi:hypothetical protein